MDDESFLAEFEACTLVFEKWNHRAHVKVAYLYLKAHSLEEATDRIRAGIKRELRQVFGISHSTVQIEFGDCADE